MYRRYHHPSLRLPSSFKLGWAAPLEVTIDESVFAGSRVGIGRRTPRERESHHPRLLQSPLITFQRQPPRFDQSIHPLFLRRRSGTRAMQQRMYEIKYFSDTTGQWGISKPPTAPGPVQHIPDVRFVSICVGASASSGSTAGPGTATQTLAASIADVIAQAHIVALTDVDELTVEALLADPRVRSRFATTDVPYAPRKTPGSAEVQVGGAALFWTPQIGVQLVENYSPKLKSPAVLLMVRQLCGGPVFIACAAFDAAMSRSERIGAIRDGVFPKAADGQALLIGMTWPLAADASHGGQGAAAAAISSPNVASPPGSPGPLDRAAAVALDAQLVGGAAIPSGPLLLSVAAPSNACGSSTSALVTNSAHLRVHHTMPTTRTVLSSGLASVLLLSIHPVPVVAGPATAGPAAAVPVGRPPVPVVPVKGSNNGASPATGSQHPPLPTGKSAASPPTASASSTSQPGKATPPTVPAPTPAQRWPNSPLVPLPASQQLARAQANGASVSPMCPPTVAGQAPPSSFVMPPSASSTSAAAGAATSQQPPPSYRVAQHHLNTPPLGPVDATAAARVATPPFVATSQLLSLPAPSFQWSTTSFVSQKQLKGPVGDALHAFLADIDISQYTASADDAVKQLNSNPEPGAPRGPPGSAVGPARQWPCEYAFAPGRLVVSTNAPMEPGAIKAWFQGRRSHIASILAVNRIGPPSDRTPTTASVGGLNFGPSDLSSGTENNNHRSRRRHATSPALSAAWSTGRAVLVQQLTPLELKAFDVSRHVASSNALQNAVDRLNQGTDTVWEAASKQEYALVYSQEKQAYYLLANGENTVCDVHACRVAAIAKNHATRAAT